jgi:hypothetical protein
VRRIVFLIGVAMCALALCGLSSKYTIQVTQSETSSISFKLTPYGRSGEVDLNNFLVVKRDNFGKWDYRNPLWAFELPPGSSKPISKIIYGKVPLGFTETVKAKALAQGVHYLAVGLSPGAGGSIEFIAQ